MLLCIRLETESDSYCLVMRNAFEFAALSADANDTTATSTNTSDITALGEQLEESSQNLTCNHYDNLATI